MASPMNAVKQYAPEVKQQLTVSMKQLVLYLAGRTNMNEGTVVHLLTELRDALVFFNSTGHAVKMDGIGTFKPTIRLDGALNLAYLPDKHIKNKLNDKYEGFSGEIKNKDMIGKTMDDIIARWNREHPDDPIREPGKKDKKK